MVVWSGPGALSRDWTLVSVLLLLPRRGLQATRRIRTEEQKGLVETDLEPD